MALRPIILTLTQAITFGFPAPEKMVWTGYTHLALCRWKSTPTFMTNIGTTFEVAPARNDGNRSVPAPAQKKGAGEPAPQFVI